MMYLVTYASKIQDLNVELPAYIVTPLGLSQPLPYYHAERLSDILVYS